MTEIRISLLGAAAVWVVLALSPGAFAQSICGATTKAAAGETLADIAERCDVTIEALRRANPTLDENVAEGADVAIPAADAAAGDDSDILGRARELLRDAGEEIEDAARQAGKSVSDYLASDPNIGRDLREFGQRYGLPGFAAANGDAGAGITLTPAAPRAGEKVTITASGLAADTEAEIGIGPSRTDYETVAKARTDAAGRLETTLTLPDWVSATENIVVVVDTPNVLLRSDPVEVSE
jgi:hypothetical protein